MREIQGDDRVFAEQAWEDEAGNYHDDFATVKQIRGGRVYLKFDRPEIDEFLDGCDYHFTELEVIGNIYENPELLSDAEKTR